MLSILLALQVIGGTLAMANGGASSFCEYSGIPFGGLGTGSVELRGDGHFHQWQIMNNAPFGNGPATAEMEDDGLFFGVAVGRGSDSRVLMLGKEHWADSDPYFSWESLRWTCDPYHMPWMEYPERILYEGRFPFADLAYETKSFPVAVSLSAFSPFIPLDAKNSALPVAFLTFTLANRTNSPQQVALFGALKNCVGYDHGDNESVIQYREAGRVAQLEFARRGLPEGCQSEGTMAFGVWSKKAGPTTYVLHAVHPRDIYDPVMETGRLENLDRSVFRGSVGNDLGTGPRVRKADVGLSRGVLCKTVTLKPRETAEITFALAWHFPNMAQRACRETDAMEIMGHQYSNWFSSAPEVLSYCVKDSNDLRRRSKEFVDAYYATDAPTWMLDTIAAQLTSFTKSTWWDKSGRFAVWEGLGCCGLQTLDITLYGSFPIVLFFPELEKSQTRLIAAQAEKLGRPPHSFHMTFSSCCVWPNNRIDNSAQFILVLWRDALWTGDIEYAKELWPAVEIYLRDIQSTDKDGDGLPNNAGVDQSYDQFPLFGTSAYVGFQYAGALKGASELARMIGLDERARELADLHGKALAALEEQLWNGEYYNLSFDKATGKGNAGCMADQLCGDWFVRETDGRGIVDAAKARAALAAVFKYCFREEGFLANCEWPRGGRVKIRRETSDQANCPWTGVEFAVAAEMELLGMKRQARAILRGVRDRYDRLGMRYNHIECGSHYYRAMSSWAPYLAMTGFAWDAPAGSLTLHPPKGPGRCVWNTPAAWGTAVFGGGKKPALEIQVVRGTLRLQSIRIAGKTAPPRTVRLAGRKVPFQAAADGDRLSITFARDLSLGPGKSLVLTP